MGFSLLEFYTYLAQSAVRVDMGPYELALEVGANIARIDRHFNHDRAPLLWRRDFYGYLKDSEMSALAGRLGDALGLMHMARSGFPYFAHFQDIKPPAAPPSSRRPDYVLVSGNKSEGCVLENKGGVSKHKSCNEVAERAVKALAEQVSPWLGGSLQLTGVSKIPLSRGVAVGACVKMRVNRLSVATTTVPHRARPTVLVADIPLLHYFAWLGTMGLYTLGASLLRPKEPAVAPLRFVRAQYRNRTYLFPRFVRRLGYKAGPTLPAPNRTDRLWGRSACFLQSLWPAWLGLDESIMRELVRISRMSSGQGVGDSQELFIPDVGRMANEDPVQTIVRPDGAIATLAPYEDLKNLEDTVL